MDYSLLKDFLEREGCSYRENEPMASHTTFKIGGPADIFVQPATEEMVSKVVAFCNEKEYPIHILGNGSNLLVSDLGVEGVVIHISGGLSDASLGDTNEIVCGSGMKLSMLCSFALENSLTGLEFAWGIPGLVGGAVYMNAGAYDSEISNVITECRCVTRDGRFETLTADKLKLGYRTSIFKEKKNRVITSAKFRLNLGVKEDIRARMDELMARRKSKQPLEFPSAGSTFKRPTGNFAGTLIERCGLKGFTIGGAAVSEKHAGFVVNMGGATASDVKRVIEAVSEKVFLETSIRLEPEVEFIGR
ncbi:MAG: UDP-N-acetylmuramate dehydrogenase [Clostridia bacterium]|nr:UDP-N-acetylmuramate dehydrogenase [Clostridia bacterium]